MFDALKETIIGPNPCPWPKKPLDTKDLLIMALLYIMFLILTKGVTAGTAFAMASKKYGIAEDVLRTAAKDQPYCDGYRKAKKKYQTKWQKAEEKYGPLI